MQDWVKHKQKKNEIESCKMTQSSKLTEGKTLNVCKKSQLRLQILEQGKILRMDIGNTYRWGWNVFLWAITKYEWISISIFLTVFIASSKHFIHFHINKRISSRKPDVNIVDKFIWTPGDFTPLQIALFTLIAWASCEKCQKLVKKYPIKRKVSKMMLLSMFKKM